MLITERDGDSVDLGFGGEVEPFDAVETEKTPDTLKEAAHARIVEYVSQGKHGHAVDDLAEGFDRRCADAQGRAVRPNEPGKARLDCGIALTQRVILCVADLRSVETIVELVVVGDDLGKPLQLSRGLPLVKRRDRLRPQGALGWSSCSSS